MLRLKQLNTGKLCNSNEKRKIKKVLLRMQILSDFDLDQALLAKFRSFSEPLEIYLSFPDEPFPLGRVAFWWM